MTNPNDHITEQAIAFHVTVNGQSRQVSPGTTVRALIESMGMASIPCAAEVNSRLVRRSEQASHLLHPGDSIELVSLVGGG